MLTVWKSMLEWHVNCILRTLRDFSKEQGHVYNSIVWDWAGAVMLNKAKIGQRCAIFSDWVIDLLSDRLTDWGIDWLIDRCCSVICGPLTESAKILNEFGHFRGFEKKHDKPTDRLTNGHFLLQRCVGVSKNDKQANAWWTDEWTDQPNNRPMQATEKDTFNSG